MTEVISHNAKDM